MMRDIISRLLIMFFPNRDYDGPIAETNTSSVYSSGNLQSGEKDLAENTGSDNWDRYQSLYEKVHSRWNSLNRAEDCLVLSIMEEEREKEALENFKKSVRDLYKTRIDLHELVREFKEKGVSLSCGIVEDYSDTDHPIANLRKRVMRASSC